MAIPAGKEGLTHPEIRVHEYSTRAIQHLSWKYASAVRVGNLRAQELPYAVEAVLD